MKYLNIYLASLLLLGLCVGGCAQKSDATQDQAAIQKTTTPTQTKQDLATSGTYIDFNMCQAPGTGTFNGGSGSSTFPNGEPDPTDEELASVTTTSGDGSTAALGKTKRTGFVQINNIHFQTGGTTPSATGSTTGSAQATQTASGEQTASPIQDIKPEISLSLNAAFAPGGMIDQLAAAVGKGSLSDLTKENQQDLRAAYIKGAQTGGFEQFAQLFASLFPPPTTQPAAP